MDHDDKAKLFREMHRPGEPFVLPNASSVGEARMLAAIGADAIATTSSGYAFTQGLADGINLTRDQMLDHCEDMVRAVDLPVSADLENGYADDPDGVAETVELAGEIGLAGCALEDTTFEPGKPSYDFDIAVARIAAAVEVAEAMDVDFTICARADGVMIGAYDLEEAIRRCQAFIEVGAHCVYVPVPGTMEDLALLCSSVEAPVNALASGPLVKFSRDDFAKAGAARISIGGGLGSAMQRTALDIGRQMIADGDFTGLARTVSEEEINALLKMGSA
ncbi:isocitrate lyase/phosphoenolpyruvate mutase family protein [Ahrensia sp. R2A130]|uniref:isocitrate lyase/PEP mutase family protein n=1 Tax=Ahrensia sp. R2A130 TaxID=744979 RepID=UPI0001E09C46|nr:isocitrate lyase/phosphoenolpyruvate mutase family protein [Ahrensia sp. R2A130]EFL89624.1 PEP phosphonomutase [Ahrensia sp. R2A130]